MGKIHQILNENKCLPQAENMNIQEVSLNVACMVPNIRLNQFVSY